MILGVLGLLAQDPLAVRADSVALRHDALHYEAAVVLPDTGSRLRVEVRTRWRLSSGEPIRLDLDTAFTVEAASVNGRAVTPTRAGFWLLLTHSGKAGDSAWSVVRYAGVPRDGMIIRDEGGNRTYFADNWPDRARGWLATQNHPGDKATIDWRITAPRGLTVVANGTLKGVDTSAAGATWSFSMAQPIPVHTMVIGAARFAVTRLPPACAVRCVPQSVYSYPADSAFAMNGPFRRAVEIVDLLSRRFGPFPYDELRHVQSATRFGGMENSTAIFYSDRAWSAQRMGDGLVAHEAAHQWFGDALSQSDWHHLWLSEGFATYGAALWAEHTGGRERLAQEMREAAEAIQESDTRHRPILDSAATDLMGLLNPNNYQKGSWVLHTLRGLIGDSAFFRGLRTFYERYRHRNALSRDFARVMEEVSGRDLDWYFQQALTQPGYPVLEVLTERKGDSLVIQIAQVQDSAWGRFRLPGLVLQVDGARLTVDHAGPVLRQAVLVRGPKTLLVTVDPDGWWLVSVGTKKKPET